MPIYEFHCSGCGRDFEELVFKSSEKVTCPDCGGDDCEKLMSAASFRSVGSDGNTASRSAGGSCGSCSSTSCSTCGCH